MFSSCPSWRNTGIKSRGLHLQRAHFGQKVNEYGIQQFGGGNSVGTVGEESKIEGGAMLARDHGRPLGILSPQCPEDSWVCKQ